MINATYRVVEVSDEIVFIEDLANQTQSKSVTNDAEAVVAQLNEQYPHKRIVYKDTMGSWDELVHVHGLFVYFSPYSERVPLT